MNPFDLRGPEFLAFYFCFSLVVIFAIVILRRVAESGEAPKMDMGDPYLIAYLRGGANEVLRVAVVSLVDRGMLIASGQSLRRADHVAGDAVKHPIEYEVLKKFGAPGDAASIFKDERLKSATEPYRGKLEFAGLLPDKSVRQARWRRLLIALAAIGSVGVIKIQIGLYLGRPVGFLVVMMIAALIGAAVFSFPRLTVRGKTALADIRNIYAGLKTRVNSINPGSSPAELAMFAAVFGVGALAATPFGYAQTLFPQASSGSSYSSSCGSSSSSSCGSSDGGGGCGGGGCGGCGS